jgi:hypothetical protein
VREQERRQDLGRASARTRPAATRDASPAEGFAGNGFAGIGAQGIAGSQDVLALQRLAGNDATVRMLARQGHRQDTNDVAERAVSGHAPPGPAVPVQRMPWPDPAAAHRQMLERGWRRTEDGHGYTRAPLPEVEATTGEQPTDAPQQQPAPVEDEAVTLRVLVRKNASFRDPDYLERVGHSWVAFYKGDKFHSSAGFYPKGGQLNQDAPHRSVPGEVRKNYDDPKDATTELSVPLTQKQFAKAEKYIADNLNHSYNVLRYNCTDFVIGVHKAALGHSPPGRNLLLPNNPNDLHAGIKKHNNSDAAQEPATR